MDSAAGVDPEGVKGQYFEKRKLNTDSGPAGGGAVWPMEIAEARCFDGEMFDLTRYRRWYLPHGQHVGKPGTVDIEKAVLVVQDWSGLREDLLARSQDRQRGRGFHIPFLLEIKEFDLVRAVEHEAVDVQPDLGGYLLQEQ